MYSKIYADGGIVSKGADARRLAIFKGSDKSLTEVEGLPALENLASLGIPFSENGKAYIPVVTTDKASPAIYVIDPAKAQAVKGLTIVSDAVSVVGKLTVKK